jgi:hypothetical protein
MRNAQMTTVCPASVVSAQAITHLNCIREMKVVSPLQ